VDGVEIGKTGLAGWREKVADGVADPLARRTPLSSDAVRAIVGVVFFVMSVKYVVSTITRAVRTARSA
jgi:hypothetical protein